MRVIKEGKKPVKEIEKTCPQCSCVFAYERKDVKAEVDRNITDYHVVCPCCGKRIYVDAFSEY